MAEKFPCENLRASWPRCKGGRNMGAIVTNLTLLKAMARANLIVLDDDTGKKVRHWTGIRVKAMYIDRAVGARIFDYKGQKYEVRYFDGCFNPFVVKADEPAPSFV